MFERIKVGIIICSIVFVSYGLASGLLKMAAADTEVYTNLSVFTSVLDRIQDDYVEVPDMDLVLRGAIQGMMEAVDPYSSFVDTRTYEEISAADREAGIGVALAKRYGYVYVVAAERGGPAWESGLRSGDLIETIEGKSTGTMSLWEAEQRMKGKEGSTLSIRVIRTRRQEPLELSIVRAKMVDNEVSVRVLEKDLGLVRIPDFRTGTEAELTAGLNRLISSDVQGLIIDVRGTFAGDMDEAVRAADLFLAEGQKIASIKIKDREVEVINATEGYLVGDLPMVILADSGTCGSAEIFVAALRDNDKGVVLGEKTEGKGSVQKRIPLESAGFIYLSRELVIRPDGEPIQNKSFRESGIEPDTQAPSRDFVSDYYLENTPEGDDEQLGVDFFKNLDAAIEAEQMRMAKKHVRELINNADQAESGKKAA